MVLTAKQRGDLHAGVLEYLRTNGFSDSAAALERELVSWESPDPPPAAGSLEKKWTSVVRLQRKAMELESRCAELTEELSRYARGKKGGKRGKNSDGDSPEGPWMPTAPAKHRIDAHRAPVTHLTLHPVFPLVVSCSEDGTAKCWDLETGEYERTFRGHTDSVQGAAFRGDGAMMATCSADLSVKLWNFGTSDTGGPGDDYSCVRTLQGHGHNVSSVSFVPSGEHVLSSSRDGTVRVWEAETGFCVRTFRGHGDAWVRRVTVDSTGALAASCSDDHRGIVWDTSSLSVVSTLRAHEHVIEDIAFSPGGDADGVAAKAIAEAGASVPDHGGKSERPGDRFVVTCSRDKRLVVFDAATGAALLTLVGHDNWVRAARFHPSGTHVLSVADDKSLRVWDLRTGRCSKKITDAHSHFVSTLAVWAQAGIVVTGSIDNGVKIWESV